LSAIGFGAAIAGLVESAGSGIRTGVSWAIRRRVTG
jgi:hypothetical protein